MPANAITIAAPAPIPGAATLPPLEVGDSGDLVKLLQSRLHALGLRPGGAEGEFGWSTHSAVLAFQKLESIDRTGDVDAVTWLRLSQPQGYRPPVIGTYVRVDTDLDRQVLFVANGHGPGTQAVLNTSSGGNYEYVNPETKQTEFAGTPTGSYAVYHKVNGDDKGPLGVLYRPQYFEGGYAIHGSPSVPAYPASHGCLRVSNADMDWLWERIDFGTPVAVYDAVTLDSFLARRLQDIDGLLWSYSQGEPTLAVA